MESRPSKAWRSAPSRSAGAAQGQAGLAEPGPRHLAVIGDRLQGGALVEALRLLRLAERLGCPALPVGGPRHRDRALGDRRHLREMLRGGGRIAGEAQGDPAGMELGLDPLLGRARRLLARHRVGGLGVAEVEELARHDPALDPPLVAVDQHVRVARRRGEHRGGGLGLVGPAEVLRPGEDVGRVAAQRRRHRGERGRGAGGLVLDGPAGAHEAGIGAARVAGRPAGALPIVLQERPLHPVAVVDPGERVREGVEHLGLEAAAEALGAPEVADDLGGVGLAAVGAQRQRQGELARRARRLRRGEEGPHRRGGFPLGEQRLLGPAAQQRAGRPVRIGPDEGDRAVEADAGARADRHPFEQRLRGRIGEAVAHPVAVGDPALAVEVDGAAQQRRVGVAGDLAAAPGRAPRAPGPAGVTAASGSGKATGASGSAEA